MSVNVDKRIPMFPHFCRLCGFNVATVEGQADTVCVENNNYERYLMWIIRT